MLCVGRGRCQWRRGVDIHAHGGQVRSLGLLLLLLARCSTPASGSAGTGLVSIGVLGGGLSLALDGRCIWIFRLAGPPDLGRLDDGGAVRVEFGFFCFDSAARLAARLLARHTGGG